MLTIVLQYSTFLCRLRAHQLIKQTIAETFWGEGETGTIPVHTVDSFQGCETEIVILSTVRCATGQSNLRAA